MQRSCPSVAGASSKRPISSESGSSRAVPDRPGLTVPTDAIKSWDEISRSLPAMSPHTGPFPHAPFLEAWASHRTSRGAETFVARSVDGALPAWIDEQTVRFQGEADLTDYHSPLGGSIDECVRLLAARCSGYRFSFDSLTAEALDPLERALGNVAATFATGIHATALVVDLPQDSGEWLASLPKKHRHEVRRKQRNFHELHGTPTHERRSDPEAFRAFISMHRAADGDKGTFMTEERESFFLALVKDVGASIDLLCVAGRPVAAAFGFAEADAYYLYNSSFEPEFSSAAPGIVLLASMLDRSVEAGLSRFDFLKGDERYKKHLGAVARELSVIEGVFA